MSALPAYDYAERAYEQRRARSSGLRSASCADRAHARRSARSIPR